MVSRPTEFTSADRVDIAAATDRLFLEMAATATDPAVRAGMLAMNAQMRQVRLAEDAVIPDRAAEFQALSDAWNRRDVPLLQTLITAYFDRREGLLSQLSASVNRRD